MRRQGRDSTGVARICCAHCRRIFFRPRSYRRIREMMNEGAQAQIQQRPEEAAQLAADFASITGEQVTVVAAQQMSNIVCLDMENAQGPGALGAVSAAMATETGSVRR